MWARRSKRPHVLYVTTLLHGHAGAWPCYRDTEYFERLTEAAAALAQAPVRATLKTFRRADHAANPIADWVRRHRWPIRVVDGSLEPWMRTADLVCFDLPSTGWIECLAAQIPTITYCDERVFPLLADARTVIAQDGLPWTADWPVFLAQLRAAPAWVASEQRQRTLDSVFLAAYGRPPGAALSSLVADILRAQPVSRFGGMPLIGVQHGGMYGYLRCPQHIYHELIHYDDWVGWGRGVIGGLRQQYEDLCETDPGLRAQGCATLYAVGGD